MLGTELVSQLRKSGTGPRKLAIALAFLQTNPLATAQDTFNEMVRHARENRDVGFQGTLNKAGAIIDAGRWLPPETLILNPEDEIAAIAAGRMMKPPAPPPATFDMPTLETQRDATDKAELLAIVNKLMAEVADLKASKATPSATDGEKANDLTPTDAAGGATVPPADAVPPVAANPASGPLPPIGPASTASDKPSVQAPIGPAPAPQGTPSNATPKAGGKK